MGTRNLTAVYLDGQYKVAQYGQWGYHGVQLAAKWNLDALPTDEEFLAAFKNDEEEEAPTF